MDCKGIEVPDNACPACETGSVTTYATRIDPHSKLRMRYQKCNKCGYTPGTPALIPLVHAPAQPRRLNMNRVNQQRLF